MNSDPFPPSADLPVYDAETDTCYSIEVIAELAGVNPQTVLHYQEQAFIRPAARKSRIQHMKRESLHTIKMPQVSREQWQPGLHRHRGDPQVVLADPLIDIGMPLL